jgi:2-oxoglutarate ferredoxin oxidoreductase subunit beta
MHPMDNLLHADLLPSAWCAGCGIGTTVYALAGAVTEARVDPGSILLISGWGCTGRVLDYVNLKVQGSGGRHLLDMAADQMLIDSGQRIIVLMNNADLLISGAEDLARATRRNGRLLIIHINNLIYVMTKDGPVTYTPYTRPSWDGRFELPFNLPGMAMYYGANYEARWTQLHAGWLKYSIIEAFAKNGVSFIEVVTPCLLYDAGEGQISEAFERMRFYDDATTMRTAGRHEDLDIRNSGHMVIGRIYDGDVR